MTYGHHAVWPFVGARNEVGNHADRDWMDATQRPAAQQVGHLRRLMESRPYFDRMPDQSLLAAGAGEAAWHVRATRDRLGSYAFVYFPTSDQEVSIDLSKLRAPRLRAWWFDPRTGIGTSSGSGATRLPSVSRMSCTKSSSRSFRDFCRSPSFDIASPV